MASVEERLQQLEDRQAIRDLVAEYCRAIDDRDLEAFVGNYTDDCVHRQRDGSLHLEGRAALRKHYAARFLQYGVTLHTPHAHVITFDGLDSAHGWVSGHAEMGLQGEGWLAAFRYADEYRREDGVWLFAKRELNTYYYLRMADLATGLGGTMRRHYQGELRTADLPEGLETYKRLHGLG